MVLEKIGLMGVFLVKNTFTRMHCEFLLLTYLDPYWAERTEH